MKNIILIITLFSSLAMADSQKELTQLAKKYLGGKYLWGGETPQGFDCSGYTQYIFNKIGITLPRTAYQQSKVGETVEGSLEKGDLLFFNTDPSRGIPVTHVGVYLENGKFIHAASSKKGIIISPLTKQYQHTYLGAKRLFQHEEGTSIPIVLPKEFFHAYKKALIAPMKTTIKYDLYRIYKGQYLRESQIKELEKMEEIKKEEKQPINSQQLKKFDTKTQITLKNQINQERLAAIPVTYSAKEAEELGAFEERALSEEDALEAIEESI